MPQPFAHHTDNVIDTLRAMPADHALCVITSPPSFCLRDYGLAPVIWEPVVYAPVPGLPETSVAVGPAQRLQNALWQAGDIMSRDVLQCAPIRRWRQPDKCLISPYQGTPSG
ncbi:MAG: hypothetical protein HKL99_14615 [Burkholderiales bacterium]|nr:hypothetical protein [Burkholderiales bacterium]